METVRADVSLACRCLTDAYLEARLRPEGVAQPFILALNHGERVTLRGRTPLAISMRQFYRPFPDANGWSVRMVAYYYSLFDPQREILMYHWHPEQTPGVAFPHLHLEAGAGVRRDELTRAHLPTGWVPLEAVLRLAISDFGAEPLREDWRDTLADPDEAAITTRGDVR